MNVGGYARLALTNSHKLLSLLNMSGGEKASGSGPMLSRFSGEAGQKLLLDIVNDETLLRGTPDLESFIAGCELIEIASGKELIKQGDSDNDLFIIISGSFDTYVNGRHQATRKAGQHVGEIALIDSTVRRTATVIASEHSIVLKCGEKRFVQLANAHPKL